MFVIKTTQFEGPLDILLTLIERRKLHIGDFSLASIADDYLSHTTESGQDLGRDSEFLVIAAALVLIKSKSLLPTVELTDDEQASIDDLKDRLAAYRVIKYISPTLEKLYGNHSLYLPRRIRKPIIRFNPGENLNSEALETAARGVVGSLPQIQTPPKARVRRLLSLDEVLKRVNERVRQHLSLTFSSLTKENKEGRVEIVMQFLAVLELIKQDAVDVDQLETYGDIRLETREVGVPRYN